MQPREKVIYDLLKYVYIKYGVDFTEGYNQHEPIFVQGDTKKDIWDRCAVANGYTSWLDYDVKLGNISWVKLAHQLKWLTGNDIITNEFIELIGKSDV